MSHKHLHAMAQVAQRQADDHLVQTVVNIVYVTADPATAATTGSIRYNGHPIGNTRATDGLSTSAPTLAYSAPARQHKPLVSSATTLSAASPSYVAGSAVYNTRPSQTTLVSSPAATFASVPLASSGSDNVNSADVNSANVVKASDTGLSSGGKAGIAIGVLLAVALIAGIAWLCYPRRKRGEEQLLDDEKTDLHKKSQSVASHVSVRRHQNSAPRLSLRPVTQMFPMSEKHDASSLIANSAALAGSRARTPEPINSHSFSSSTESSNPFDDQDNNVIATPVAAAVASPFESNSERTATGLSQESATSSQYYPTVVAGSRRNSPPGQGPNNIHRVQLDFKPSMEDELELRAGSLVRLLHEYDDGWALCIRLDRSQQGVVPRTCVSKLPVKPRPGPPPSAGSRPPPQSRTRGPSNAPGPRMATGPRPMGSPPNGRHRAQTNGPRQPQGPQFRERANSEAMSSRRITPPSRSQTSSPANSPPQAVPARKPVPGQAL